MKSAHSCRKLFTIHSIKHFCLLLCLLLVGKLAWANNDAHQGTVKGTVTTADGKAAEGITVSLKGTNYGVITNANGYYILPRIKPGNYTVRVFAVGLLPEEKAITVAAGKTLAIDFVLKENLSVLQEVTVTSARNKYKADQPSSSLRLNESLMETPQNIQVITAQTLADQQVISMSDGAIRNVSGATRLEHWGDMYTRVNMRGSRAAAFRNGMNVTSNWGPLNEDMSFVDRIEFIKGPAGFMMSNGEPSGIYNVVTKKPTGKDFNGEATVNMGSYDLYRAALSP